MTTVNSIDIPQEEFVGEFHDMDLSELKDKLFLVAMNSGDRNEHRFMCSTVSGPFDFIEMLGAVEQMWRQELLHSKVYVLDKNIKGRKHFLEANVIDYIEAKSGDLIMEELLLSSSEKEYTCKATLIEAEEKKENAE